MKGKTDRGTDVMTDKMIIKMADKIADVGTRQSGEMVEIVSKT